MITIITPTYKRDPKLIRRCIESVIGQSYKNWEMIIVSDTSSPEEHVTDLVSEYTKDSNYKIKYFYNSIRDEVGNTWGAIARNIGIENADKDSEYIIFLDDDNILFSHALRTHLEHIGDHAATICNIYHHGPLHPPYHTLYGNMQYGFHLPATSNRLAYVLTGLPAEVGYIDSLNVMVKTSVMKECKWIINYDYVNDGQTLQKLFSQFIKNDYKYIPEILGSHL